MKKVGTLSAIFGLMLAAGEAAATISGVAANINPIFDNVAPYPATIVLRTTFSTTAPNQLVRVIYNAECSIGGGPTAWLNDDIIIDPAGAPAAFIAVPSNSDNALCSGNGTPTENDGWVSAVTQVVATIPTAGVHAISVRVNPSVAQPWRVDDQSLVVDTQ